MLVNVAAQPVRPAIYFYDKAGGGGGRSDRPGIGGGRHRRSRSPSTALTLQGGLHPFGEGTLSTHGRGETVTGSVKMVSDGPEGLIGVGLRFDLPGIRVLTR